MVGYTEVILRRVPGCYLAGSFPGVVPPEGGLGDGDVFGSADSSPKFRLLARVRTKNAAKGMRGGQAPPVRARRFPTIENRLMLPLIVGPGRPYHRLSCQAKVK